MAARVSPKDITNDRQPLVFLPRYMLTGKDDPLQRILLSLSYAPHHHTEQASSCLRNEDRGSQAALQVYISTCRAILDLVVRFDARPDGPSLHNMLLRPLLT